jgi:hypothetical protein
VNTDVDKTRRKYQMAKRVMATTVAKQRRRPSARMRRTRKEQRFAEDQIRAQESVRDDAMEHALKIKAAWQKAVISIIETGRLLIEAKKKLPPGVYGSMFGTIRSAHTEPLMPFSKRTAERLMRIASHKVLHDATHVSRLPPSWGTLYVLSAIQPKRLKQLIEQGKVDADMTRKDATRLLAGPDIERLPRLLEELNRIRTANPNCEELARAIYATMFDDELVMPPDKLDNVGTWLCACGLQDRQSCRRAPALGGRLRCLEQTPQ